MSIPASELVDLQPRTIGGGLNGIELNGVFLTTSSKLPINTVRPFYSPTSVGDYFGEESQEYSLALNYFNADDNKQKSPSALYFYRFVNADAAAWLRGAAINATLTAFQAITDGAMTITVNGTQATLTGIDLSTASSFSAVAQAIQTKLAATSSGATVVYDSGFNAFIITSGTSGAASAITYPEVPESGTDLSALMNLYEADGAVISQGVATQTLTAAMQALININQNWFSFMPVFAETDDQRMELAQWCTSKGTRFMYTALESNANALIPNNVACFGQMVANYYGIANMYNTKALSAFAMGFVASIDWARTNGRKTFAYKSQSGLSPTVSNVDDATALLGNGYNFYGDYATAAQQFRLAQNGQISGPAKWMDTYAGQVWFKSNIQAAWLNVLNNANFLPYNEDGYSAVRAGSMDSINAALNSGIIVRGVTLSQAQINEVNREAGLDISDALYNQGWYLQIPDVSATVRANREAIQPNFWYCDGGSIQKIQGTATTIL